MQFLALSAFALAVIGRSLAEPIPINAMHHDKLVSRVASNAPRFNELPANDPNAFWPCLRCAVECGAVVAGCGIVCAAAEIDGPLCGVSDRLWSRPFETL